MGEKINPIGCRPLGISSLIDYEYQQIIRKLAQYGLKPSGSKSVDRERLHKVELQEAQKENFVSSKFLTVTTREQEKIQEEKKEKREENNPELYQNKIGQELLGQQIMIAIDLKDKFKTE